VPPIKALFVYNSNPAAVCPNHNEVVRGLKRPDLFTVVHEQFFTDTTDYADIVLPATTFFEHKDLQTAYVRPLLSSRFPIRRWIRSANAGPMSICSARWLSTATAAFPPIPSKPASSPRSATFTTRRRHRARLQLPVEHGLLRGHPLRARAERQGLDPPHLRQRAPTIREINYTGLNAVSTSDVLDRFKERKVGLSVRRASTIPPSVKKAEVVLKELLAEHGRQFATIRTEVRPIPPAAVGITFVIKEGPQGQGRQDPLPGNKHVNDRTLRAAMKNLKPIGIPHSIFLENLFAKTYDATKLEEDAERVRAEFQNRGYFKVWWTNPRPKSTTPDSSGFHVRGSSRAGQGPSISPCPIEEGERYRLKAPSPSRTTKRSPTRAPAQPSRSRTATFSAAKKSPRASKNLRKAYGEAGYINFTSVPDTSSTTRRRP
jgi:hypothetical protein